MALQARRAAVNECNSDNTTVVNTTLTLLPETYNHSWESLARINCEYGSSTEFQERST